MVPTIRPFRAVCAALGLGAAFAVAPASALTIDATFDSSITSSANAPSIEASIDSAIGIFDSLITTNETVSIDFQYTNLGSGVLGASNFSVYTVNYSTFVSDLTATSTSANDATALANLNSGNGNTAANTQIALSSANARAIGLSGDAGAVTVAGTPGTFDGVVKLGSTQPFQFSTGTNRTIAPGSFDAMATLEHEIDEVLGLGSGLDLNPVTLRPQDLFRYSAPGVGSFSANATSSYFSIDGGKTSIVGFNQNGSGDFGDWLSPSCPQSPNLVQYAFTCAGGSADVTATSPEGVNLDVIGYTIAAVPEPETLALFGIGLLGAVWARRRGAPPRKPERLSA
jgi:hypothetical protein